ncbi:extracellular solute-binding protein [Clostridium sp.]|uniref:extracellular solute-binding protein n=1 Tax=Clostridium sp. TaxID=1506 RepID=UPI0026391925|nr:extracellular solute-binding protein [Clostridium sp.]
MLSKKLTKLLATFLVVGVSIGTLAGCSGKNAKDSTSSDKEVELTLWVTSREQDDFTASVENEFLKKYPNIKLNKVVKEGDPGNEFYQGVAAGNAPDLIEVSFTMMDKYMKAGILEPLNDNISKWDEGKGLSKKYLDMLSLDGKVYGIPSQVNPMFFGYNKKLFADASITSIPKTWDESLADAKKLTIPEKQQAGYGMLSAEWTEWFFQYYVWQAGGDLTKQNSDDTLSLTFTDPAVIKAAEFYQTLIKEKVIQSDLTLKFNDLIPQFAAGKIAMMPFAGDWVSWATSLGMNPNDIGLALFPAGPSGKRTTAIGGNSRVINAKTTSEKKDAAFKYISFYESKEEKTKFYKNIESKGVVNPVIIPRDDLSLGDIVKIPEEYSKVLNDVQDEGRLEFYGKATVASYIDKAVQKVISDPTADPTKEFKNSQDLAEKEVLEKFNKDIKATK